MRKQLLLVTLFVFALRLPFLNQAIQGDDIYYLYGAEHAQIEPLHPNHARYPFLGQIVDMRGHPHPPFDAWFLGALLAAFKDISEVKFHAAFILFSLIAAWAALALAHRFSPRPLAATLLFLVTPAFVVNGNSLESDLPFVAFWLASIAFFVYAVDRASSLLLALSVAAMLLASLTAYQAIVLTPILLLYAWRSKPACIAAFTPPLVIGLWQLYERSTSGALPAAVLAGYMQTYGLQAFAQKIRNAEALTGHLAWVIFPVLTVAAFWRVRRWRLGLIAAAMIAGAFVDPNPLFWASIGVGLLVLFWSLEHYREFLAQWILVFFAAALVIFFAGSARYLLPIALPLALLIGVRLNARWLYAGAGAGWVLSLLLAVVNYQHWDAYRQFARSLKQDVETKRVWVNGDWGLRFYLEAEGALPLMRNQAVHPGEMVVSSSLALPIAFTTGGGFLTTLAQREVTSPIPLRLVALHGHSGYSTTSFGLRPFDISRMSIDRVRAETVIEKQPSLTRFPMNAPEAREQIVSGIFDLEEGQWRWMGSKAVLLLKAPAVPEPVQVRFTIPPRAPARQVTVSVDEREVARQTFPGAGAYVLTTPGIKPEASSVLVSITVDQTFTVPGDARQLGIILSEVGFGKSSTP